MELVSGELRIFSGESVQLRCSIPDDHRSTWSYLWFRGSEQLPQSGERLVLWKARVQQSGKYYCQGLRDTAVGNIRTLQSLPLEINVDGKSLLISIIRNFFSFTFYLFLISKTEKQSTFATQFVVLFFFKIRQYSNF